jgi:uncharacterized membrane protein YhaH (DUF805 family)
MFCSSCGEKLDDGTKFCPKCGTKTDGAPTGVPAQSVMPQYVPTQPVYQQQPQGTYQQPVYQASGKNAWQYFTSTFKQYAVFTGRARRAEYWWFILFFEIFYLLCGFIDDRAGLFIFRMEGVSVGILSTLVSLVFLLPSFGAVIRRMHDLDKSGWYCLIPVYNIVLCCTAGTIGPNRFGPDPK